MTYVAALRDISCLRGTARCAPLPWVSRCRNPILAARAAVYANPLRRHSALRITCAISQARAKHSVSAAPLTHGDSISAANGPHCCDRRWPFLALSFSRTVPDMTSPKPSIVQSCSEDSARRYLTRYREGSLKRGATETPVFMHCWSRCGAKGSANMPPMRKCRYRKGTVHT
jgi:hypothetical protein